MGAEKTDAEDQLEEKRACLNQAIVNNDMDLLDPEVIKISRELDQLVVDEMSKAV